LHNFLIEASQTYLADFSKIDLSHALRFNQGDGYFADQGVVDEITATEPGNADDPLMIQMLTPKDK
jgi:hypothetical protein